MQGGTKFFPLAFPPAPAKITAMPSPQTPSRVPPSRAFLRTLARQARGAASRVALYGLAATIASIAQIFSIGAILAEAIDAPTHLPSLPPILAFAASTIATTIFTLLADRAAFRAGATNRAKLRHDILARIFSAGPSLLRRYHSAELTNLLIDQVEALDGYFARYTPAAILAILSPALTLAAAFWLFPRAGFIMLAGGLFVPLTQAIAGIGAKRASEKQFLALQRLQTRFLDRIRGIATIVLLGRAQDEAQSLGIAAQELRGRIMRVLRVAFLSSAALDCAMAAVLIFIAITSWRALNDHSITAQTALTLLLLVPQFFAPLRTFALAYQDRLHAAAAAASLAALPEIPAVSKAPQNFRNIEARGISVTFENVSFTWDKTRAPALEGINFFVSPGELVVLAGKSGAGKSTIIELLLGFVRPDSGMIKLNGLNFTDIVPEAFTELTAWIGQRPMLFAATIAENIAFAKPGATPAQIHEAARAAQVMDFADGLPQGLQTRIGEGGFGLSGGQAQRIAIARAFLKNAPLLLLDEPTSHLDPLTESSVLESLKRLALGRTVIMASHSAAAHAFGGRRIDIKDGRVTGMARGVA